MAKRPKSDEGTSALPRTRTSRVPLRKGQGSSIWTYMSGACRLVLRVLTIARLVEAMLRVAVRREDGDFVAAALQPYCRIDHQPLCPSYSQIGVKKDDVMLLVRHRLCEDSAGLRALDSTCTVQVVWSR